MSREKEINFETTQKLTASFVDAHSDFVKTWTEANIKPGSNIEGTLALAAEIGMSSGIFCLVMGEQLGLNPHTLKAMILTKLDAEIVRGQNGV